MMTGLHGQSLIDGSRADGCGEGFQAVSALDRRLLPGIFRRAGEAEVDRAMAAARRDFPAFRDSSGERRAELLENLAGRLLAAETALGLRIREETGLTEMRIRAELGRTVGQLRMYAALARDHGWCDPRIETAVPDRLPLPKPDLRRLLVPLGPVVVFGSSNFPLAYSVAGGDTVSALATGNPVVVKAHAGHPGTSEIVGEAVVAAVRETGLPAGVFAMLHGEGHRIGIGLVRHPAARAVGFTGSYAGGRALFDAAAGRPDPIPVFAEMSGLNPIVVLPGALRESPDGIAGKIVDSISQGMGQFCTKPGLLLVWDAPGAEAFEAALARALRQVVAGPMLHAGIADAYAGGCARACAHPAVTILAQSGPATTPGGAAALLVAVTAEALVADETLRHEVFGPFAMVVRIRSRAALEQVLRALGGQLTAAVFGGADEPDRDLVGVLSELAGRVIVNGVPTGVEVCDAIQHGGPWPATTDSRFGAVGPRAFLRFVRPVAFQNTPDRLLPEALRDANPLGLVRRVNGVPDRGPVVSAR